MLFHLRALLSTIFSFYVLHLVNHPSNYKSRKANWKPLRLTWNAKANSIISRTNAPAALHTCTLSREVLSKTYRRLRIGTDPQIILVDFIRDTIFFDDNHQCIVATSRNAGRGTWAKMNFKLLTDLFGCKQLFKLARHVAFESGFLENFEVAEQNHMLIDLFNRLTHVNELLVVPKKEWEKIKKERTRVSISWCSCVIIILQTDYP